MPTKNKVTESGNGHSNGASSACFNCGHYCGGGWRGQRFFRGGMMNSYNYGNYGYPTDFDRPMPLILPPSPVDSLNGLIQDGESIESSYSN